MIILDMMLGGECGGGDGSEFGRDTCETRARRDACGGGRVSYRVGSVKLTR